MLQATGTLDLERVSGLQWTRQELSVKLPFKPHSLRLIEEEIWQCYDAGISVRSAELDELRHIDSGNMGEVCDVAALPDGRLVVGASRGLYHINKHGKRQLCYSEWLSITRCQ